MPPYLVPLRKPCATCGKPATQTLMNSVNAKVADYCDKDAGRALTNWADHERALAPKKGT